jgi:hypothetical protein
MSPAATRKSSGSRSGGTSASSVPPRTSRNYRPLLPRPPKTPEALDRDYRDPPPLTVGQDQLPPFKELETLGDCRLLPRSSPVTPFRLARVSSTQTRSDVQRTSHAQAYSQVGGVPMERSPPTYRSAAFPSYNPSAFMPTAINQPSPASTPHQGHIPMASSSSNSSTTQSQSRPSHGRSAGYPTYQRLGEHRAHPLSQPHRKEKCLYMDGCQDCIQHAAIATKRSTRPWEL